MTLLYEWTPKGKTSDRTGVKQTTGLRVKKESTEGKKRMGLVVKQTTGIDVIDPCCPATNFNKASGQNRVNL